MRISDWSSDVCSSDLIDGAADIVEEVVRIEGLDKVPSTPLPRAEGVARPTATAIQKLERRVRRAMATRGSNEAVTWSFIAPEKAEGLDRKSVRVGKEGVRTVWLRWSP